MDQEKTPEDYDFVRKSIANLVREIDEMIKKEVGEIDEMIKKEVGEIDEMIKKEVRGMSACITSMSEMSRMTMGTDYVRHRVIGLNDRERQGIHSFAQNALMLQGIRPSFRIPTEHELWLEMLTRL